jgi:ABC-type transport system involved in cytochrome c biogenesis permease subunit
VKVFYALALYAAILLVSLIPLAERMSRGADLFRLSVVVAVVLLMCVAAIGVLIQRGLRRS